MEEERKKGISKVLWRKKEQPPLSFHFLDVLRRVLKCCSDLQGIHLSPQQHFGELSAAAPHLHRGMCGIRAATLALGLV